jgi:hypothetical protein
MRVEEPPLKGTVQRNFNIVFLPVWIGLGLNMNRSWSINFFKGHHLDQRWRFLCG